MRPGTLMADILDALPPYPTRTTLDMLRLAFPHLQSRSIENALGRLKRRGLIEHPRDSPLSWRRSKQKREGIAGRRKRGKAARSRARTRSRTSAPLALL